MIAARLRRRYVLDPERLATALDKLATPYVRRTCTRCPATVRGRRTPVTPLDLPGVAARRAVAENA